MEIVNLLDRHLKAIEDSQSDAECYKHIHGFIKLLLETPTLKVILDAEEDRFRHEMQFTEDNLKVEEENFYQAYFVSSYVRIYLPIKHYWNSDEPDEQQDPLALLLLWGRDQPRTKRWINGHEFFTARERKKTLRTYERWFDHGRQEYVQEIKNLHLAVVSELAKGTTTVEPRQAQELFVLDTISGDFRLGELTGTLNVSTQEFRVIATLYTAENYRAPYLELINCLKKIDKVTKPDKESLGIMIRNLKMKLGILPKDKRVNEDIFINEVHYGYRLGI